MKDARHPLEHLSLDTIEYMAAPVDSMIRSV